MDDINELKTMVVNLFDCVKNLNVTASKLFANQQIFMKKQDLILKKIESLYPRVQEQEYQLEELTKRFYQNMINAPAVQQFENTFTRPSTARVPAQKQM